MKPATQSARSDGGRLASSFDRSAGEAVPGPFAGGVEGPRAAPVPSRDRAAARRPCTRRRAAHRPSRRRPAVPRARAPPGRRTSPARRRAGWPPPTDRATRTVLRAPRAAPAPLRPAASRGRTRAAPPPPRTPCPRAVGIDTGGGAVRHPAGERGTGERGQQLGGCGTYVTAAVRQGLLQEGLVVRREAGPQGVEEHEPVLGPFRGPRGDEQGAALPGSWSRRAPSSATRSAKRPSCQSRRTAAGSDVSGRRASRDEARRANRHSGLSEASQSPRGPANASTCGRRSVRALAASSSAGSSSAGAR